MRDRDVKQADLFRSAHSEASATATCRGYLKTCEDCGEKIYLKEDYDQQWRPYESWKYGNKIGEGEWKLHECKR